MDFKFKVNQLKKNLPLLKRAFSSAPSLPVLNGILFYASGNQVMIQATDLYFGVNFSFKAEIKEEGRVVVRGQQLIEIINSIDKLSEIHFFQASGETDVTITSGQVKIKLPTYNEKDFPSFPKLKGESYLITQEQLRFINQYVTSNASTDLTRPILTGILFDFHSSKLVVAATDGYRLATADLAQTSELTGKIIIPAKIIKEIEKTVVESELKQIILEVDKKLFQAKCIVDNVDIFIRLIEGEYPPYEKIIPPKFNLFLSFLADDLLPHLKRAKIFAKNNSNIVQLRIKQKTMEVFANSLSMGIYTSEFSDFTQEGEGLNIAFNVDYLIDFLQKAADKTVKLAIVDSLKPIKLTITGVKNLSYIVMPIKVHSEI